MINKKIIFSSKLVEDDTILWKDIKDMPFQDNDIFEIQWVEDFKYHEYGGYHSFEVVRYENETYEEEIERLARYETYIELKKEFEGYGNHTQLHQ